MPLRIARGLNAAWGRLLLVVSHVKAPRGVQLDNSPGPVSLPCDNLKGLIATLLLTAAPAGPCAVLEQSEGVDSEVVTEA